MTSDHSQNGEATIVAQYFGDYRGHLLDIGANPTFSNSTYLIELGWRAQLIEPSPSAHQLLVDMWGMNYNVKLYRYAISSFTGSTKLYESGPHLSDQSDVALLSGFNIQDKWKHLEYTECEVAVNTFAAHFALHGKHGYDFITIDAEGSDWDILQQINLAEVGCKCLCIEWNSDPILKAKYTFYVKQFGMKLHHSNAENLIFII